MKEGEVLYEKLNMRSITKKANQKVDSLGMNQMKDNTSKQEESAKLAQ